MFIIFYELSLTTNMNNSGQKAGMYNNSIPVANSNGRTDVEGKSYYNAGLQCLRYSDDIPNH